MKNIIKIILLLALLSTLSNAIILNIPNYCKEAKQTKVIENALILNRQSKYLEAAFQLEKIGYGFKNGNFFDKCKTYNLYGLYDYIQNYYFVDHKLFEKGSLYIIKYHNNHIIAVKALATLFDYYEQQKKYKEAFKLERTTKKLWLSWRTPVHLMNIHQDYYLTHKIDNEKIELRKILYIVATASATLKLNNSSYIGYPTPKEKKMIKKQIRQWREAFIKLGKSSDDIKRVFDKAKRDYKSRIKEIKGY